MNECHQMRNDNLSLSFGKFEKISKWRDKQQTLKQNQMNIFLNSLPIERNNFNDNLFLFSCFDNNNIYDAKQNIFFWLLSFCPECVYNSSYWVMQFYYVSASPYGWKMEYPTNSAFVCFSSSILTKNQSYSFDCWWNNNSFMNM